MTWLSYAWPQVLSLGWQHLLISVPAILGSILIAIPVGRLANRYPRVGGVLLSGATLLYAIPALPLLIIIPVLIGVPLRSPLTVIVALTLYGIALLVRTSADAFHAVDQQVTQAAVAIGYSPRALFWRVELPLSIPVLISGIRVVTVSTVGLVTIGALVGVQSLGTLFTDGFQRGIQAEVFTGIVATVVLALALDGLVVMTGRLLAPWQHRSSTRTGTATAKEAIA